LRPTSSDVHVEDLSCCAFIMLPSFTREVGAATFWKSPVGGNPSPSHGRKTGDPGERLHEDMNVDMNMNVDLIYRGNRAEGLPEFAPL